VKAPRVEREGGGGTESTSHDGRVRYHVEGRAAGNMFEQDERASSGRCRPGTLAPDRFEADKISIRMPIKTPINISKVSHAQYSPRHRQQAEGGSRLGALTTWCWASHP